MVKKLRSNLNKDEFEAFKSLFLELGLEWKDCENQDICKVISEQHSALSRKFNTNQNSNFENDQSSNRVSKVKSLLDEFIIDQFKRGVGEKDNLVKLLNKKLRSLKLENLKKYLNQEKRKELDWKELSIKHVYSDYSTYFVGASILGAVLQFMSSIAFFISNGIFYNLPIAFGFLINWVVLPFLEKWGKNEARIKSSTNEVMLTTFNSLGITAMSLMFYGIGLDLMNNGFSVVSFLLLSGLLLSLPATFSFVVPTILDAIGNYFVKRTAVNLIEEQFRGSDQPTVDNNRSEDPSSAIEVPVVQSVTASSEPNMENASPVQNTR